MSDTLNYPLQQGLILASTGVAAGLILWIFWPRYLPQTLPPHIYKVRDVPTNDKEARRIRWRPRIAEAYRVTVAAPVPLYLVPVAFAMLADPHAAIFAPLLFAWIRVFEPETPVRRILPAAIVCGGFWIIQTALTPKATAFSLSGWWATAPWVSMRYLATFFDPARLTVDSGLQPFASLWSPLALAGFAAVAGFICIAVVLARHAEWRTVSFGIWWFLIALLPDAIVPQHTVEAPWRMFLPSIGLVLAASQAAWIGFCGLRAALRGWPVLRLATVILAWTAATAVLAVSGWQTHERNAAWESEETLWRDAVEKNPRNAPALLYFGNVLLEGGATIGYDYLLRAAQVLPNDPAIEVSLARAAPEPRIPAEIEKHLRRAILNGPAYAPAFAEYSRFLVQQRRFQEAFTMAAKAVALDRTDLIGRHALMDYYSDSSDWANLNKAANDALRLDPEDPVAQLSLALASSALSEIDRAERQAKLEPGPESYLTLSVVYFKQRRFAESEKAAMAAQRLTPDETYPMANLATIYLAQGKIAESIGAWREVLKRDPDFPSAKNNLDYELELRASRSH